MFPVEHIEVRKFVCSSVVRAMMDTNISHLYLNYISTLSSIKKEYRNVPRQSTYQVWKISNRECVHIWCHNMLEVFIKANRDMQFLSTYLAAFASFKNFLIQKWKHYSSINTHYI